MTFLICTKYKIKIVKTNNINVSNCIMNFNLSLSLLYLKNNTKIFLENKNN